MRSNKKTKNTPVSRFLASRLFLIVALPAVVLVCLGNVRSYYSGYKINQEIEDLQRDIESLEHKKLESMEILNYVMSEGFVEEKARTELNMKKEGENVVVFKNNNIYNEKEVHVQANSGQIMTNPLKWWYYFTQPSAGQKN